LIMMIKRIKKGLVLPLAIVVFLCVCFSGCGKKGPPLPPDREKPHSIFSHIGLG
jgi:predicted small lipoprotein YifL